MVIVILVLAAAIVASTSRLYELQNRLVAWCGCLDGILSPRDLVVLSEAHLFGECQGAIFFSYFIRREDYLTFTYQTQSCASQWNKLSFILIPCLLVLNIVLHFFCFIWIPYRYFHCFCLCFAFLPDWAEDRTCWLPLSYNEPNQALFCALYWVP